MNCPNCGAANAPGAHFCGECGTSLPAAAAPPPPPTAPTPPTPPGGPPPTSTMPPVPPPGAMSPPGAGPPPGAPPYVPPGPAPEPKSRRALIIGLVAILVALAVAASFLVLGGGDGDGGGDEIVLEPISSVQQDDFFGNLDLDTPGSSLAVALPDVPPLGSGIASALSGLETDGDTPGLYGGSRDVAVCDVEQLLEFLLDEDNEDKAEAWAGVLDIDVDDIEDFVADLTPVRLRFDTRVTNHTFSDGEAPGFQSILEKGTAVLVDDRGVPRVKCNCGNPLLEPAPLGDVDEDDAFDLDALAQNPDDAWDDFDPELVVAVEEAGDAIEEFVLVDIDDGSLFARPKGTNGDADVDADLSALCDIFAESPSCGAVEPPDDDETTTTSTSTTSTTIELGTGDVQITLQWGSDADLDLAVTDPLGERLDFGNTGPTSTGGELDVDSNVGCENDGSIENIFWPPGGAPAGEYVVEVNGFQVDGCGGGDYVLTIRVSGQDDQVIRGSVGEDETDTHTFTV